MPQLRIFNVANMSFKAVRENKIIAKIPEFTVFDVDLAFRLCQAVVERISIKRK